MRASELTAPLAWWNVIPSLGVVAVAVGVHVVLGPVFSTPQVGATVIDVPGPTAILSGLLIAFAVAGTLKEPVTVLPLTGARRVRGWRVGRVLGLLALSVLLLTFASPSHAPAAVSCACALSGEVLVLARVLWEEIAWALPLLHAGLTLTFGTDPFGSPHAWAWILDPDPTGADLTLSIVLLAVGLSWWARRQLT